MTKTLKDLTLDDLECWFKLDEEKPLPTIVIGTISVGERGGTKKCIHGEKKSWAKL